MTNAFDFAPLLRAGLPPAAAKFTGVPKYNFVGGHGDPDQFPLDGVIAAANSALQREGRTLATYGFGVDGPQGHRGLREFLVKKLKSNAGIDCTIDNILITSGSLQALDLVNGVFLAPGDTVVIERDCYQGTHHPLRQAWRERGRHPARPRRHADRCAVERTRRPQAPRRAAEIHLYDSDRAQSDLHDPAGRPARGAPETGAGA